jgi:N-acetylmuramoyl-L-alanine amidase
MRNSIITSILLASLLPLAATAAATAARTAPAHGKTAAVTPTAGKASAAGKSRTATPPAAASKAKAATAGNRAPGRPPHAATATPPRNREIVIAIDAGHGGKDTGAIGPNGSLEKTVTLAIARKLETMIKAQPGMKPAMIRSRDEFIDLRERAELARKAKADLFISLHADAYDNAEAKGSSVYTLSRSGASSEAARWLADGENAADLVGGVKLKGRGKILASVLLDLAQNASIEASDRAAVRILRELQKTNRLHQQHVQKAGFVVLKSPDVPSLLVETAFISNADEEKNLTNPKYQDLVARCIFNGVRGYFSRNRAPGAAPQRTAAAAAKETPLKLADRR